MSDDRLHANFRRVVEWVGVTEGPLWEAMAASLLSMDGEPHRKARGSVAPAFTPRAVERVRPFHRRKAIDLVASLASSGGGEVVHDFAAPYVTAGICDFVGFEPDRVAAMDTALYRVALATKDIPDRVDLLADGIADLVDFASDALARRRREPAGDILTRVVEAVDAGSLAPGVAAALVAGMVSAGHEPTINQIALMVATLAEVPEVWVQVSEGRLPAGRVVEEVLRFRGTNQGVLREVVEPFAFGGADLRRGETICVSLADANHDPRHHARPEEFDVEANRESHLAFGVGPHHCLGAAVARLQLQEALRAMTERLGPPTVHERVDYAGGGLQGPRLLRVSFAPL